MDDASLGREHIDRATAVGDDLVEIQIHRAKRIAAGVGAREDQHVLDEAAQAPRLTADDRDRLAVLGLVAVIAAQHDVGRRAHDGDRRPQLVRGVGHELPLRLQGRAEARDEPVEGRGQLTELVGPLRLAEILETGQRNPGRAPRHVGDGPKADRRQPQAAAAREQQHDRDPDEHRLLRFALLAEHIRHGAGDEQDQRAGAERARTRVHAPGTGAGVDAPDAGLGVAARRRIAQLEAAPPRTEHTSARVENRERAPRRGHGRGRLGRGRHGVGVLLELVLDDIRQCGRERFELAVHATDANPALLPQHVGAEQAQHDEQRERVPQREARAQRQHPHDAAAPITSW